MGVREWLAVCAGILLIARPLASVGAEPASTDADQGSIPSVLDRPALPEVVDAAAAWTRFLGAGRPEDVAAAMTHLGTLLDEDGNPNPERCRAGAEEWTAALQVAPVSLIAWHIARACAEVEGDEAVADHAAAAFGELAGFALSSNPTLGSGAPPIRILTESDVYALAEALGHEVLYVDYVLDDTRRHLPIEAAVWDAENSREIVFRFDYLDVWMRLQALVDPLVAPVARAQFAAQVLEHSAKEAPQLPAAIALARKKAILEGDSRKQLDAAVQLAGAGDIGAARSLANFCLLGKDVGCGQSAVDGILPFAEQRWVLPSVWLAIAYAKGRGVDRDARAADRLLDSADRRSGEHRATLAAGMLLLARWGAEPLPDALRKRLKRLARAGVERADHLLLLDELLGKRQPSVRDRERLALAAERGWAPLQVVAAEAWRTRDPERALNWLRAAAAQGDPLHQVALAQTLQQRETDTAALQEAESWRSAAAHGGSADSALGVARRLKREGRLGPAQAWFVSSAAFGEPEGAYQAALMFVDGGEGVRESHAVAHRILSSTEALASHVPARRLLADLLMFGDDAELRDTKRAGELLRLNVAEGDLESTTMLGEWLLSGRVAAEPGEDAGSLLRSAAERGDAEAMTTLGMAIYRGLVDGGDAEEALSLLGRANEGGSRAALNNLAWVRCTAADPDYRDPAQGLVHARELARRDELPAPYRDTIAACHAANGDYATAVEIQRQILAELDAAGADADQTRAYRDTLALYQKSQPFREAVRRGTAAAPAGEH